MATLKLLYSAVQTMVVTALQSLASSATAGWQSAVVDNTTDLYEDALVQVILDFANTAPSADKCAYVFAYSGLETAYADPASGTEGSITLATIASNPQAFRQIGTVPYNTQDAVVESSVMSVAAAFGGVLPPKWGIVVMNYSGAALAGSGNTVKWMGVTHTIA